MDTISPKPVTRHNNTRLAASGTCQEHEEDDKPFRRGEIDGGYATTANRPNSESNVDDGLKRVIGCPVDAKIQTYSVTTSLADDLAGNKAGDGLTDEHWEEEGSRANWRVGQGDLEELREIIERGEEYHSTSQVQ